MSDSNHPDPSQPPPSDDGAGTGGMSEAELDSILAESAGLVSELTRQVGAPDATTAPATAPTSPDPVKAVVGDQQLDAEMDRLDSLLSSAAVQVGAAPSTDRRSGVESDAPRSEPPAPMPANPVTPSQPGRRGIPDFMQEFTQADPTAEPPPRGATSNAPSAPPGTVPPPTPANTVPPPTVRPAGVESVTTPARATSAAPPPSEASPAVRAAPPGKPGVVGTGMLGVVASQTVGAPAAPSAEAPSPVVESVNVDSGLPNDAPPPIAQRILRGAAPHLMKAASKGVNVLEGVNRPFGWIERTPRYYLGLAALATLATALVVLVISSL